MVLFIERMNMINSKNKGSEFERAVAKMLTLWSGYEFHRTPMSGALHWTNDKRVVSDIVPPQELIDEGWPFSIECKKVENSWEFNCFLDGTSQTLKEHWKQCCDDAVRECMVPMLVFSKNRRDIFVMLKSEVFKTLCTDINLYVNIVRGDTDVTIAKLSDVLFNVSLDKLLSLNLLDSVK